MNKGGTLSKDQGQTETCYAYAYTRMILNLMKNLKIIDDIKNHPEELNALNEIEYSFMDKSLPQVKQFINGDNADFKKQNELLSANIETIKTNKIKEINDSIELINTEKEETEKLIITQYKI